MKIHQDNYPVLTVVFAVIIASVISMLPEGFAIGGVKLKKIDFLIDVRKDEVPAVQPQAKASVFSFDAVSDFIGGLFETKEGSPAATPQPAKQPLQGNTAQLKPFFDALKQTGSKRVRIAHLGDSAIEGDVISFDLRRALQKQFGGGGVGFVGMTSMFKDERRSVKQDFSSDWKKGSIVTGNRDKLPVGLSGEVWQSNGSSFVKYDGSQHIGAMKTFNFARIYYKSDKAGSVKYSLNNGADQVLQLKATKGIEEVSISGQKITSLKITATDAFSQLFYGVSLEDGNGIYLDNMPLRGNSGLAMREVTEAALAEINKTFDYKLIVLQFGLNALVKGKTDYKNYEEEMGKVITMLKRSFPGAGFVLVSVQDKGDKIGTKFGTDESVPALVEAQKRIADKAGIAFWNLFEAMGGKNSIVKWVDERKAQKDYTHLEPDGAKAIADMLFEALTDAAKK